MHQTEPQNPLPLVFKITDPSDTATYYVRAILRDSLTGSTIQSVNLTNQGGGRFTSQINAPADPSGLGRHIDITKTVYTDSGYTTKSEAYREEIDYWYIKTSKVFGGGGGSSGEDVDYERIRDMIIEVINEKLATIIQLLPEKTDITPLLQGQTKIEKAIQVIKSNDTETKEIDLKPVLTAIQSRSDVIVAHLGRIEDKIKPQDNTQVLDRLGDLETVVTDMPTKEDLADHMDEMKGALEKIDENRKIVKFFKKTFESKVIDRAVSIKEEDIEDDDTKILSPYIKRK